MSVASDRYIRAEQCRIRAELRAQLLTEQLHQAAVDAELLEDRIHALVAALERYGHHECCCAALGGGRREDCSCGLREAVEGL